MVKLEIEFSEDEFKQIEEIARRRGLSVPTLLHGCVQSQLCVTSVGPKEGSPEERRRRREELLSRMGSWEGVPSDASVNHDAYWDHIPLEKDHGLR